MNIVEGIGRYGYDSRCCKGMGMVKDLVQDTGMVKGMDVAKDMYTVKYKDVV